MPRMNRQRTLIAAVVVAVLGIAGLLFAFLGGEDPSGPQHTPVALGPTATPRPTATVGPLPRPGYTPVPADTVSPVIVDRQPARGAELAPGGAIQLVFDRPMDQGSVESALSVSPAVQGEFSWPDARTVRFTPNELQRASLYDVVLSQVARAADGAPLNSAYQFRFPSAGYLEVAQVLPADGAVEVEADSVITVIFNRPVVPLTIVEEQDTLPEPLRLDPPVEGTGEWLSTSIYVFRPAQPLAGGTAYTAQVSPDLVDLDGNPLRDGHTWRWATKRPQVLYSTPTDGQQLVSVEPVVYLQLDQPVDPESVRAAFELRGPDGAVPGALQVLSETITFTPEQRLAFDANYTITLKAGVGSRTGGAGMASDFSARFRTVPLPRIVRTNPADGDTDASPYTGFEIVFSAPISPETVMDNLEWTPPLTPTQVYTYFYDTTFYINYPVQPSTDYVVKIGPNISDPYGNLTGQTMEVRFRTAPLDPAVSLVVPQGVGLYDASQPAQVGLLSTNMDEARLELYRLPNSVVRSPDLLWNDQRPAGSQQIRSWTVAIDSVLNERRLTPVDLVDGGGRLEPGVYELLLDLPQSDYDQRHLMVVSDISLTLKAGERDALAWATRISTGEPVSGVPLRFYDNEGRDLGSATTGADGVARIDIDRQYNASTVALAEQPFAALRTDWGGYGMWMSNIPTSFDVPEAIGTIYTDRAIYRPAQSVYFKGVLWREDDADLSPFPAGKDTEVVINSPTGEELQRTTVRLNANGTFSGELELPEGAALGYYNITATHPDLYVSGGFQVAAYRAPEFEVTVATPSDALAVGETLEATAQTSYFFGAPVASVPVRWNVLTEAYRFSPEWASRYTFGEGSSWGWGRCWECWWEPAPPTEAILSGDGTTDAQGRLTFDIPAELTSIAGVPITGSTTLILEATATGRDNQVISGRTTVVRHQADVYVGVATNNFFGREGERQVVDLVSASSAGQRVSGVKIDIAIDRVEWDNVYDQTLGYWTSEQRVTPVTTLSATTDGTGSASVDFTPDVAGSYRITATARDAAGRQARTVDSLWVIGEAGLSWRRDQQQITLISDKTSYRPGETATILVPSPFPGRHRALVTVERGGILRHEVLTVENGSLVYQLPLDVSHTPNIYVSVVLVTPPSAAAPADYRVGVLPLSVEPLPQSLNVTLTPSETQLEPGSELSYDVQVTDVSGRPVSAELSFDLVDKAVLSIQPRTPDELRAFMYAERPLGIQTAVGLEFSADRVRRELQQELDEQLRQDGQKGRGEAEGGNAGGDTAAGAAPPIGTLSPAMSLPYAPGSAAEEMADADLSRQSGANAALPTIRQEFSDTAFWRADVTTDAQGKATVEVTLPDNLTTWVMRGVALNSSTQIGEGLVEVVAAKPLLIRPVTPRFFVVGDTAELSANVSNSTDRPIEAQVTLSAEGLTVSDALTKTITVPAKGEASASWQVEAQDVEFTRLVFSVSGGGYSDASTPRVASGPDGSLPVYRYSAPEVVGTGGVVAEPGSRTEAIGVPPWVDERSGELTVRVEASLAAGIRTGLDYLDHYDYKSAEAIVSSFVPNVMAARALEQLGLEDPALKAQLDTLVPEALQRLAAAQNADGGWGWWDEDEESIPELSAYVLFGMQRAREAGYTIDQGVVDRGLTYLEGTLPSAREVASSGDGANRQAWLLYVLADGGRVKGERIGELFEGRERLSTYGRALLALTIEKAFGASDERVKTLLSDINNAAILSATGAHWEESRYSPWSMGTDTRSTAIILQALVRLDPENQLIPNAVRWLMVARQDGIWETTQENAWAIMALTDWMVHTGELEADYDVAVWLNDRELASGHFDQDNLQQPMVLKIAVADLLAQEGARLTLGHGEGPGRLYYTAHLRAFLPVEQIEPLNRGVIVSRRYVLASCTEGPKCPEVEQIKVGDVVRVELTIVAPHDRYYLTVEDPLPAGLEAIDTSLNTTSILEQGPRTDYIDPEMGVVRGPRYIESEPYFWWPWWNWYSRSELRDEKVVLFADVLPKGTYLYSYTARATTPGAFHAIPTTASETYFPEVYGRGAGHLLTIAE